MMMSPSLSCCEYLLSARTSDLEASAVVFSIQSPSLFKNMGGAEMTASPRPCKMHFTDHDPGTISPAVK